MPTYGNQWRSIGKSGERHRVAWFTTGEEAAAQFRQRLDLALGSGLRAQLDRALAAAAARQCRRLVERLRGAAVAIQ